MSGELALILKKWGLAEKTFQAAIDLDNSGEDPFLGGDTELWKSMDGLGTSLLAQKRYLEATVAFTRAREVARSLKDDQALALAEYHFSSACALAGYHDYAVESLKHSMELDPKYREAAQQDSTFRKMLGTKEFGEWIR